MRVVLACESFVSHGVGIAPYTRELCRALAKAGHELLVVTNERLDMKTWELDQHKTIPLYPSVVPKMVRDEVAVARRMFDRIVDFDPDGLISSDHIYLTSLFGCFADRRIRISVSHFYTGLLPKTAACRPQVTDWIISLSEASVQFLATLPGCSPEQIVVVYNAVQDANFNVTESIQDKANQPLLSIVYPGGNNWQKSPEVILKVAKRLAQTDLDWQMVWLGPLGGFARRIPASLRRRINFTGLVARDQAEQYISQAQCFLLPSRAEGCPVSLIEAMRAGTIPLVSDCPSAMRELVTHGVCGYVVAVTDARALASHLAEIAGSQQLKLSLMLAARRVYEEKLTADIWAKQMNELLTKRRPDRAKLPETDRFDPTAVLRWARRPGRWYRPTISYLRTKFGYPNLSPLVKK